MKKVVLILMAVCMFTSCSKTEDPPIVTYTVTFDAAGGTPIPQPQTVNAGEKATAPTNPSKQGFVFLFWHLNGASTAYNFATPVTSNITLQAKWEDAAVAEYWQVAWELNGGAWPASGGNHVTQVVKGGTLAEPATPTKSGLTFDGWYKEAALTNKINFPYDVSTVTANFTLYAKWTTGGGTTDPAGYKMFTSIVELKSWLASQPVNTAETPYKVGLKNVNLDAGNNWGDLGLAISNYTDLYLLSCTGTAIPDGYQEKTSTGVGEWTVTTYSAFAGRSRLVAITLPKGLKTIGKWAFYKCANLNSVTLPEGLININDSAFEECRKLNYIAFPHGLKKLGNSAFNFCSLTSVTIPGTITDWGYQTFYNNYDSLISVVVQEGVETIGISAFWACNALKSVILPDGLKTIEKEAFRDCIYLSNITLPSGLTSIGEGAFSNCCYGLTSINLPEGIKIINNSAFRECALTSITLPTSLESIGDYAFYNSPNLTNIEIPSKVTYIGQYAFSNISNNSVTFVMRPATPPTLGFTALSAGKFATLVIKVPATNIETYKTAGSDWSRYTSNIVANTN